MPGSGVFHEYIYIQFVERVASCEEIIEERRLNFAKNFVDVELRSGILLMWNYGKFEVDRANMTCKHLHEMHVRTSHEWEHTPAKSWSRNEILLSPERPRPQDLAYHTSNSVRRSMWLEYGFISSEDII
jgi:hypothetical protein